MFLRIFLYAAFVFLAAALGYGASAAELKVGGTGGDLGTMRKMADVCAAVNHGVTVTVVPSLGSGGGIKAVAAGAIDVAISSRPLKDAERKNGLVDFPYAETAMAIVTAGKQAIPDLSRSKLVAIFGKDDVAWPNGDPIRVVLRPSNDGDYALMAGAVDGMGAALQAAETRRAPIGISDQDAATLLEANPGAIGFLSLSLILGESRALNVLPLDGVMPSVETLGNGTYPLRKVFHMATKVAPPDRGRDFISFMRSPAGEKILHETGHIPVR